MKDPIQNIFEIFEAATGIDRGRVIEAACSENPESEFQHITREISERERRQTGPRMSDLKRAVDNLFDNGRRLLDESFVCPGCGKSIPPGPDACSPECELKVFGPRSTWPKKNTG